MSSNQKTFLYAITPIIFMAIFAYIFTHHQAQAKLVNERIAQAAALEAAKKASEQARIEAALAAQSKAIAEAKAKAIAEREAAIRKEKEKKTAETESRLSQTLENIYRLNKELSELESQLASERDSRMQKETEFVERAHRLSELTAQRDATDLDAQRLTQMLARYIDEEIDSAYSELDPPSS